jgi:hypothetical protein
MLMLSLVSVINYVLAWNQFIYEQGLSYLMFRYNLTLKVFKSLLMVQNITHIQTNKNSNPIHKIKNNNKKTCLKKLV